MFVPTDEQRIIRSHARRLYDKGHRLVGELCSHIPELTLQKWRSWEKRTGFLDWWVDLFPEHGRLCLADMRALEYESNRALMKAVATGDLTAVGLVIKMIGLSQAREEAKTGSDDWFTGNGDGDWLPPVVADA